MIDCSSALGPICRNEKSSAGNKWGTVLCPTVLDDVHRRSIKFACLVETKNRNALLDAIARRRRRRTHT